MSDGERTTPVLISSGSLDMTLIRNFIAGIPVLSLCFSSMAFASSDAQNLESYRFPLSAQSHESSEDSESDLSDSTESDEWSVPESSIDSVDLSEEDQIRKTASGLATQKFQELQIEKMRLKQQLNNGDITLSDYRMKIRECSKAFNVYYANLVKKVRQEAFSAKEH